MNIYSLVLLLSLFVICSFAQDCSKVTNATECVTSGDDKVLNYYKEMMNSIETHISQKDQTMKQCITIIAKICVKVDFVNWNPFFENVTLEITVEDIPVFHLETTIPDIFVNDGICLDDNTIFEILLEIPSLKNDTEIFINILKLTGCDSAGIFSMCFYFYPDESPSEVPLISMNNDGLINNNQKEMVKENNNNNNNNDHMNQLAVTNGCFYFDFQLLYFSKWCVVKETVPLGCI
eukprot:TRINITY_DN1501_c1_g1_i2.p1 TRINITY_DN1501_c1_g1~~TRINITY_DN1501_c1_g1_i2.p1  ORF type:complete len:235 (-),score=52.91 TRINITY_DN1501_c1_g1_i2:787-1491(-)